MKKLILFTLMVAIFLSACGATKTELEQNKDTWTQAKITHYRLQLSVGCFCAFRGMMPLTVEVKDGQVLSILDNTGAEVSSDFKELFDQYNTIERLFDYTAEAQKNADKVTVTYNNTYGYPTLVNIDNIKEAVDDELSLSVSNFEILK